MQKKKKKKNFDIIILFLPLFRKSGVQKPLRLGEIKRSTLIGLSRGVF